jgi:predicted double-glycine peptidase
MVNSLISTSSTSKESLDHPRLKTCVHLNLDDDNCVYLNDDSMKNGKEYIWQFIVISSTYGTKNTGVS